MHLLNTEIGINLPNFSLKPLFSKLTLDNILRLVKYLLLEKKLLFITEAKGNYSFDFDEWKNISNEAKQFIKKMLEIDTSKRYSASQAMNDPWLVKFGNKNVVDIPLITKALTNMTTFRV